VTRFVVAADGGNSKTDVVIATLAGDVRAWARGGRSSHHHVGADGMVAVLEGLVARARDDAGLAAGARADVAVFMLAGVDLAGEEDEVRAALEARQMAARVVVGNDTFAVLRAGATSGWGIAITCGAGINCVGLGPTGAVVRYPALGALTGDWGGGYDVGLAALGAAARSADGRGPRTVLERVVPAAFGLADPLALATEMHQGRVSQERLVELAPVVVEAAADDAVAAALLDRLAEEIVAFVQATLPQIGAGDAPVEVVLGGGLLQAPDARLRDAVGVRLAALDPSLRPVVPADPPIVGAALMALELAGADGPAGDRLRETFATRRQSGPAPAAEWAE
jgi:N-acetylglucosamine kinase-like BadF-type ATPase